MQNDDVTLELYGTDAVCSSVGATSTKIILKLTTLRKYHFFPQISVIRSNLLHYVYDYNYNDDGVFTVYLQGSSSSVYMTQCKHTSL